MAEEVNYLEMDDEEFETSPEAQYSEEVPEEEPAAEEPDETIEDTVTPTEEVEDAPEVDEPADDTETPAEDEPESQGTPDSEDTPDPEAEAPEEGGIDYKAAYERIMAPFKANGREITLQNIEDQRTLMAKGANYEQKMRGIKPIRAVQRTLEDASIIKDGSIDENRLNFLMDVNRGDKQAIAQLLKETEFDPMEFDPEEHVQYTPGNHLPSESQMGFDEVVDELSTNDNFGRTVDIVTKEWDNASRDHFFGEPGDLRKLQQDVDNGVFEEINSIVANEKMVGRLTDLSDYDAYVAVATARARQHQESQAPQEQPPVVHKEVKRDASSKRRAVAPSKGTTPKGKAQFNPLAMSDDDFEKQYGGDEL